MDRRRKQTLRVRPGKKYCQPPPSSHRPSGDSSWIDFGLREWARVISGRTPEKNSEEVRVITLSTLRRQDADNIRCFDGPRDELVLLRQVDGRLNIFLRNLFFEDRQPDFTGQIRIQAGPFYHRGS